MLAGLAYFIPSIVATYGYTPVEAQLHSVIPWAAAIVFGMFVAYFSDKFRNRSAFIVVGFCLAITGNAVLFTVHTKREAEFAGLALYTMGVIVVRLGRWALAISRELSLHLHFQVKTHPIITSAILWVWDAYSWRQ